MAKNNMENIILVGLLSNVTVKATAKETGISESTIYKYLRDDEFAIKYEKKKLEALEEAVNFFQLNILKVGSTVMEIINDEEASLQVKLNACSVILQNSLKFTNQIEILKRIERLEELKKINDK